MWLSLHLYLGQDPYGPQLDRLLVSAVAPLVAELEAGGWIERFFFIRYRDPRTHLRLRLQMPSPERADAVYERVRSAVGRLAPADGPSQIAVADYVPEWGRYGGGQGVALAEEHFHLSSRVSLEMLAAGGGEDFSRRLGRVALSTVLLLHSFQSESWTPGAFLRWYSHSYLRLILPEDGRREALSEHLDELVAAQAVEGEGLASSLHALMTVAEAGEGMGVAVLDDWSTGCRGIAARLQGLADGGAFGSPRPGVSLDGMIASYLHMHHNRLGLAIPQEIHLARLAASALAAKEPAA